MMTWWWSLFCFLSFRALLILLSIAMLGSRPCSAQVVINEVYYDHAGKDEGWEFVELRSAESAARDLSGWRLEALDGATGQKSTLWTAPAGFRIEAAQLVCVAGASRDPAPGLLLRGVLGNGPDAVRLVAPAGVVDLVGYGPCALPELFESSPAADAASGSSLSRKPDGFDSDRNDVDFVATAPTPGRPNFYSRDVMLGACRESILPCRGAPYSLALVLANLGLEDFGGSVSIAAETVVEGMTVSIDRAELLLALAVAGSDSLSLSLRAPDAALFDIRISMLGAPDENPANDSVLVPLRASPGEVVVNEIMYRPREGMSEWLELENCAARAVSLRNYLMRDATGSKHVVTTRDLELPAGGFMILARDSASFAGEYPACGAPVLGVEGGWPALNDTDRGAYADVVELFDGDTLLVERVAYRDLLGSERGRSLERISETVCGSLPGGLWHRCLARAGATPGAKNTGHVETAPRRGDVDVSPNPFGLRRDGETVVTGALDDGETGFRVRIFQLDGRLVRRIAGEDGGARFFSCRWDGRGDDGARVRTGLYVCLVDFIGAGGGVCRREKKCVAVADD